LRATAQCQKKVLTQVSSCFTEQKDILYTGPSGTDIPGLKETLSSLYKKQDFLHIKITAWSASGPYLSTGPAAFCGGYAFMSESRI